jgi:hypothetical protein
MAVLVLMAVAHLTIETRTGASTHKPVPSEVGQLESGHLTCDLPELTGEKDDSPRELEGCPCCDGD